MIPLLDWSSNDAGNAFDRSYSDAAIARGAHDRYIRQFAREARAWGHPFFLRFDWEMNIGGFPWAVGRNGNSARAFVAMWRHVHRIFTRMRATNATWVWCPNVAWGRGLSKLRRLFPGRAYVGWTCMDGYNGDHPWANFRRLFAGTYRAVARRIAPGKPMLIGETASTDAGGSKAQWIRTMLKVLPRAFPKIRGLLWYDAFSVGPGGHTDWPIESSGAARSAFARGIHRPIYAGNRYAHLRGRSIRPPR
jgi:beta-mannanase